MTHIKMWGYNKIKEGFLLELRLEPKYSHSRPHTFSIPLMINIMML